MQTLASRLRVICITCTASCIESMQFTSVSSCIAFNAVACVAQILVTNS